MLDSNSIARLYDNVLHEDIVHYRINEWEVRKGIQAMTSVYRPDPTSLQSNRAKVANYNKINLRCAYLHKYAAFHTALVINTMKKNLKKHGPLFKELVTSGQFELCCIGGGPGTDAIGILAALGNNFGIFKKNVTIVDSMEHWKFTFEALIKEIVNGNYPMQKNFLRDNFQWDYIGLNMLHSASNTANHAISNANFISMIKFVSAAACKDTESMVTNIFRVMKPGALLLFIDNAGGGFYQLIRKAANNVGLITIFGPLRYDYSKEELKTTRFGYTSCCSTTVSVQLLQKPHQNQQTINSSSNHLQQRSSKASKVIFPNTFPAVNNNFFNSKVHSPHDNVSSGKIVNHNNISYSNAVKNNMFLAEDQMLNSKLHKISPNQVPGPNTNLNKAHDSSEINVAKHKISPKDQKLGNSLPKSSPNYGPKSMAIAYDQASYSYLYSEPVSPIYDRSSRSSVKSEPSVFDESSVPGKSTNLIKANDSNEINTAKHKIYPAEDQKLSKKLPKTSPNYGTNNMNRTYNQASYSYLHSEPVSPIYDRSSRSSVKSEPRVSHESSDNGCCSCCVIS